MGVLLTRQRQGDTGHLRTNRNIDVLVLFTDVSSTLEALRSAAKLARGLNARICLLVPQIVPYPLPLEQPTVRPAQLVSRYRTIVDKAEIETTIDLRLCRDYWDAVNESLKPGSTVIVGGHRAWWNCRWWPSREERIAKRLRARGHQVIFVETK